MKYLRLSASLLITLVSAQEVPHRPAVQTITAEMITLAGVTRVAEIMLLAEAADMYSTDFFSWQSVIGGLGTMQQQHWHVFLDGQKLDARFFDIINMNLLGITIAQIDSVQIGSTPMLTLGEYTSGGYIHFFTSRLKSGQSARSGD